MNDTSTAFGTGASGGRGLLGSSLAGGFDQTATPGLFGGVPTGQGILGQGGGNQGGFGLGFQYGGNTGGLFGPLGGPQAQNKRNKLSDSWCGFQGS